MPYSTVYAFCPRTMPFLYVQSLSIIRTIKCYMISNVNNLIYLLSILTIAPMTSCMVTRESPSHPSHTSTKISATRPQSSQNLISLAARDSIEHCWRVLRVNPPALLLRINLALLLQIQSLRPYYHPCPTQFCLQIFPHQTHFRSNPLLLLPTN